MDLTVHLPPFRPVHTLSHEEIQQERAEINSKICELESSLPILKQRQSALAPVFTLSSDVLLCIFAHLQDPYQSFPFNSSPYDIPIYPFHQATKAESQLQWIREMTHVCSSWRTLAIKTPALWTRIKIKCPSLSLEMMKRCQSAPVSIICLTDDFKLGKSTFSNLVRGAADRIKHLEISFPVDDLEEEIDSMSDVFRSLSTNSSLEAFYCKAAANINRPEIRMPIRFLQHSAHTLRYLTLLNCNFPREGLSHPIDFYSLSRLTLFNHLNYCTETLDHIRVPSTCHVYAVPWTPDNTLFRALPNTIQRFWERGWREPKLIKSISIIRPPNGIPPNATLLCLGDDYTRDENFVLCLCGVKPPFHDTLRDLIAGLPGQYVNCIRVDVDMDRNTWSVLANSYPVIKSLDVRGQHPSGLLDVLGRNGASNTATVEPFSSLESLTLGDFDVAHGRDVLVSWIKRRVSSGIPLNKLNLHCSQGIPDGFIYDLESLVEVQLTSEQSM